MSTGGVGPGLGDTPALFFSRQIGLSQGRRVPIVVVGRLTGKAGPFSIGVLNIQTDDEQVSRTAATNFSVLRIKRDILRRSAVGAMLTRRSVSTRADGSNEALGVDGTFAFFQNVKVDTCLARTRTPVSSGNEMSYRTKFDYNADRYGLQLERRSGRTSTRKSDSCGVWTSRKASGASA